MYIFENWPHRRLTMIKKNDEKGVTDCERITITCSFRCFKEFHMWCSTYAHPKESVFTTIQRVSCCLSLFMTYMLCNIMFYGIEPESGGEQKLELGPTTITWTELRIGTCFPGKFMHWYQWISTYIGFRYKLFSIIDITFFFFFQESSQLL